MQFKRSVRIIETSNNLENEFWYEMHSFLLCPNLHITIFNLCVRVVRYLVHVAYAKT